MKPHQMHLLTVTAVILFGWFTQLHVESTAFADARNSRPNIIFIMADDMGRDFVSCYGAAMQTPHIDRLANQGVRFETAWSAPICTPTRLQLLTGQYPFRTGWVDHHDVPRWGGIGFNWDRDVCIARPLRDAGYATAIGGKWQVNDFRDHPDALTKHGFDEHCVWTGYETGNPPSFKRYWQGYFQTNGNRKTHEDKYGPDVVNDFLIDFIKRHRDKPFFVYYPMMLPHGPFLPTPNNKDPPPNGRLALYQGMVAYVDELVGRIVTTVDELGLTDRTVIIFTTDNGSPMGGGQLGGQTYPAGKGRINDWGMHVPFVVRAPMLRDARGVGGGHVCKDLIDFSDVFPTFIELAGAKAPAGVRLDGRSFVAAIRGNATPDQQRTWIYAQRGSAQAVRDHQYKLDHKGGFYNLNRDPLEKRDLSTSTDPALLQAKTRLKLVLDALPTKGPTPFPEYRPAQKKTRK